MALVDKHLKLKGRKFYTNLNGVNRNNIDKEMLKNSVHSNQLENDQKRFKNQNDMKQIREKIQEQKE